MTAAARPAAYLAALAAIFGGALAVGSAVGDGGDDPRPAGHASGGHASDAAASGEAHGAHRTGTTEPAAWHTTAALTQEVATA